MYPKRSHGKESILFWLSFYFKREYLRIQSLTEQVIKASKLYLIVDLLRAFLHCKEKECIILRTTKDSNETLTRQVFIRDLADQRVPYYGTLMFSTFCDLRNIKKSTNSFTITFPVAAVDKTKIHPV